MYLIFSHSLPIHSAMRRLFFLIVLVSWCDSSTTIWAQNTAFQAVKRSTTRALVVGVSDYAQISDLEDLFKQQKAKDLILSQKEDDGTFSQRVKTSIFEIEIQE